MQSIRRRTVLVTSLSGALLLAAALATASAFTTQAQDSDMEPRGHVPMLAGDSAGAPDPPPTVTPEPEPTATPTPEPEPTAEPADTFGEGTQIVGTDIQPGTYRAANPGDFCSWERLSGLSGDFDDIIAIEIPDGPTVVSIEPSDAAFTSSDCGQWTSDLSPITSSSTANFGPGTWIVGTDIAAGTWQASGGGDLCSWERLSGFSGELDDIISIGVGDANPVVTVSASDAGFTTSDDCGTWTLIDPDNGDPSEPDTETFGAGTQIVGQDIAPGTYRAPNPGELCSWERLSGLSGEFDDIIAIEVPDGPTVVSIEPSDVAFTSSDCGQWTSDLAPITSSPAAPFDAGTWIVGTDITAGTWQATGGDLCSWERLSGFSGEFDDIIDIGAGDTNPVVTISASDAGFRATEDCGTWSLID